MIKTFKDHEISKQFVEKFNLGAEEYELFSFLAHNKICWGYVVTRYGRNGMLLDKPTVFLGVLVCFSDKFFDLDIFKNNNPIDLFLNDGEIMVEIGKILEKLEAKEIKEIFKELEK